MANRRSATRRRCRRRWPAAAVAGRRHPVSAATVSTEYHGEQQGETDQRHEILLGRRGDLAAQLLQVRAREPCRPVVDDSASRCRYGIVAATSAGVMTAVADATATSGPTRAVIDASSSAR